MNPEAAKALAEIVALDMNDMNEDQKAFLRARRSYLTSDQLVKFAPVLQVETAAEPSSEPTAEGEAPKKKGK